MVRQDRLVGAMVGQACLGSGKIWQAGIGCVCSGITRLGRGKDGQARFVSVTYRVARRGLAGVDRR